MRLRVARKPHARFDEGRLERPERLNQSPTLRTPGPPQSTCPDLTRIGFASCSSAARLQTVRMRSLFLDLEAGSRDVHSARWRRSFSIAKSEAPARLRTSILP